MKWYRGGRPIGQPPIISVAGESYAELLDSRSDTWCFGTGHMDWIGEDDWRWQLSLALLVDATANYAVAFAAYTEFARRVFPQWKEESFAVDQLGLVMWCCHYLSGRLDEVCRYRLAHISREADHDN